eukprot:TRINITY_DN257_c1_g1_i1.p1 TRINITY_DN257_c1_g1~~TRINITY_DN257_c1_g1_i1.p1  ORF type:complete len:675 (-),score=241.21 TRINITY_DN257_c1_g1_i1:166-2190(-)
MANKIALLAAIATLADAVKIRDEPGSPVSKVVTLLQDLRSKIEKDGDVDEKDYEKYKCWCKEVQKSKAELIKEQTKTIKTLTTEIAEGEAIDEKLEENIEHIVEEEDDNIEGSKEGSKSRAHDNHERQEDKAMNTKTLTDLKSAEDTLKSAGPSNPSSSGYQPKSATIMGMITDQAETTQEVEETESKIEAKAQANFDGWITDMKAELGLLKTQEKREKTEEAATDEEIAEDTEMKEDTEEQRIADGKFLKEAEQSCADRAIEFTDRVKLRSQEMTGVNKALEILDSKRALFDKTFTSVPGAPSFLQISGAAVAVTDQKGKSSAAAAVQNAYAVLKAQIAKTHSSRLAAVAVLVKKAAPEGGFAGVVKSIDGMLVTLKEEAALDKSKKDHCIKEYSTIGKKVSNLGFLIQKGSASIDKLGAKLEHLSTEQSKAHAEVASIESELSDMKKLRIEENQDFLAAKAEDQTAINVLKETSEALKQYYNEHTKPAAALVEYDPSKMSKKRKILKRKEHQYTLTDEASQEGAADGILAIMERITENLADEIADGQKAEADSQLEYEKSRSLLEESKERLVKKLTSIANMKATSSAKKSDVEDSKDSNTASLESENAYKASIKEECDWMLTKFDERSQKRAAEMDGLVRAKEILAGASFVQKKGQQEDGPKSGSLMAYLMS